MKLFTRWPSAHHWMLQLSCLLPNPEPYLQDEKASIKELKTFCGASDVRATFYTDGEWNLNIDMDWYNLTNDTKIIKVFSFLQDHYGPCPFQAELLACSNNETWDVFIAYYSYDPAKSTGIRRTYLSCSECEFLCRVTLIEELYSVFDHLLLLRDQENLQEEGGILYVDFDNRLLTKEN